MSLDEDRDKLLGVNAGIVQLGHRSSANIAEEAFRLPFAHTAAAAAVVGGATLEDGIGAVAESTGNAAAAGASENGREEVEPNIFRDRKTGQYYYGNEPVSSQDEARRMRDEDNKQFYATMGSLFTGIAVASAVAEKISPHEAAGMVAKLENFLNAEHISDKNPWAAHDQPPTSTYKDLATMEKYAVTGGAVQTA